MVPVLYCNLSTIGKVCSGPGIYSSITFIAMVSKNELLEVDPDYQNVGFYLGYCSQLGLLSVATEIRNYAFKYFTALQ